MSEYKCEPCNKLDPYAKKNYGWKSDKNDAYEKYTKQIELALNKKSKTNPKFIAVCECGWESEKKEDIQLALKEMKIHQRTCKNKKCAITIIGKLEQNDGDGCFKNELSYW